MGTDEPGVREDPGLRRQVWRVFHVGDGDRAKAAMPARVSRVLQVPSMGERGLAEVAGAQRGMVHRSQLYALGITRGSYEHRVRTGALRRVLPSVLSVVDPILEPLAHETAALLQAGDDAVLSHESAAALWGLAASPSFVAITVMGRHARSHPGLRLHQTDVLDIRDVGLRMGLPVTSPARTLIDCAAILDIDRLINEARALKLVTDADLQAAASRCPGRKGTGPLRAVLAAERETGFTRSEAERILKRLVRDAEIEPPIFNTHVEGVEADAYWPRHKLVIEVDGHRFHGHYQAFQRDRAKANKLISAGYVVLRFTWPQLTKRPMLVLATIARTLGRLEARADLNE